MRVSMHFMNGADAFLAASHAAGIDVCFANPGTTEMAMVEALGRQPGIRPVLALFEGVASGAADGYGRIAGKPASVMLHLGPGLGNATANLHNARRARSPVVSWVGDHASWVLPYDPPLASDIESIARGTAKWVRRVATVEALAFDAAEAVEAAMSAVPGVATLILPADLMEAPVPDGFVMPPPAAAKPAASPIAPEVVEDAARMLREASAPLLLLGGEATGKGAVLDAARLADRVGAKLMFEQFPRCARREPGLPSPEKLAYFPGQARRQLAAYDLVVVFGMEPPVPFFGYAGDSPKLVAPGVRVLEPARGGRDVCAVVSALCDAVDAAPSVRAAADRVEVPEPRGTLEPLAICQALARRLPEDAIVVDEGITSSLPLYPTLAGAAPHEYLACKGGSIGLATPAATGAAIAASGRRVVAYVGDGSAAYTLQSLWTQAREGLDVTTIILANGLYAVLQVELRHAGASPEGAARTLTELGPPSLDFEHLARGFGVPARTARDLPTFVAALEESFRTPGPMLIACVF